MTCIFLFVDESGTHGGSHAFALGGLAVHEDDAARLQRRLDEVIISGLGRIPPNLDEHELHVSEMRNAKKPSKPMLERLRDRRSRPNRGLVIHDRRLVAEQDIQSWVSGWRAMAGTIGQLRNLADVPLFADSRATRLLQAADLVSYALYRRYRPDRPDRPEDMSAECFATIWPRFDAVNGATHGCVHFSPLFGSGQCNCEPCSGRLLVEARTNYSPIRRE